MPVFRQFCAALVSVLLIAFAAPLAAQDADAPIQRLLQEHGEIIAKSSRRTIGPAIDALADSGLLEAQAVLERWQAKEMWFDKDTGLFIYAEEIDRAPYVGLILRMAPNWGSSKTKASNSLNPTAAFAV